MHNLIESRLTSSDASVAGLLRFLDRHAARGPFARVELRMCPLAAEAAVIVATRLAVERWLRNRHLLPVAVSIRVLAGPAGASPGEQLVRLYLAERRGPAEDDFSLAPPDDPAWWQRLRQAWRPACHGSPAAAASGRAVALSAPEGWQLLCAAISAAADCEAVRGRFGPWVGARVDVRATDLALALQPLQRQPGLPDLAHPLRRKGHWVPGPFACELQLGDSTLTEGTAVPGEQDLEAVLLGVGMLPSPR